MYDINKVLKLRIKSKMIIAFIALSTIPWLIAGLVGISSNLKSLQKISIESLNFSLSMTQNKLDMFFHSIEENVNFFISSTTFNRYVNAINKEDSPEVKNTTLDIMPEIMSFTRNKEYFHQIKLINGYGDELFCLEKRGNSYHFLNKDKLNQRGTQFYLHVANNIPPNTAAFLPTEILKDENNELISTVSCIFNVRNSNFFGALVFQIYADSFFKILKQESSKIQGTKVMLVNKVGYYLYHSEKETEWNKLSASRQTLNLQVDFGNELADKILSDPSNLNYELGDYIIAQTKVFTSDVGLDNQNTLLISVLKKDIFKAVKKYKLVFGILFLFFLLLSLVLALIATNQFIGPIRKLINKARIISTGNYDVRVKIDTNDEIEELANQFNIMASSLQQREIEINQHQVLLEQKVKDRTRDLENEKNKLNTIFNNVPIGFLLFDMENKIISASVAIERILGNKIEEIAGKNYFEIIKWKNDEKKELIKKIKHTGETLTDYTSLINKDGSKQFLEHLLIPIKNNNQIESILEIITDITERKRLQDLLIHSERLAATGELAAVIAHEIRNSLTSVRMILQLFSRREENVKPDIDSFHVALDSVNRMERVVNDLLQLARPSKLERKYENINNVLESGVEYYLSHMEEKNIEIELNLENDLPKILIDKNRIIEVFINIILNGIQAIDGTGKITISTKLIKLVKAISDMAKIEIIESDYPQVNIQEILLKKGSKVIELEISDTGRGINSNIIDQIFDPFFTDKINGTGLGLSFVKNVINKHGGIIQVQSQVQKGSKFTIYLPIN